MQEEKEVDENHSDTPGSGPPAHGGSDKTSISSFSTSSSGFEYVKSTSTMMSTEPPLEV
jgi:hypothetical protein